jgi:hypothetical protein
LLGHGLRFSARIGLVFAVYEMPGVKGNRRLCTTRWESPGRKMERQSGRVETKGLAIHAGVS